ncbi:restriction endonuclease [Nitrospirota bacterium]
MNHVQVLKESGVYEGFNRKKIIGSMLSSGVSRDESEEILEKVLLTLSPPVSTRKLFKAVKKYLRTCDVTSTMRYSLKKSIFALGPTGYPFEKYVSRILEAQGYQVQVGQQVEGRCVSHEVDVVARKGGICYMVECKFHHNGKTNSGVQTALYVHARFMDIKNAKAPCGPDNNVTHKGMLVTNTRFSSDAVTYAECVGLKAIGWKHPDHESLEKLIDEGRTYPVTVLSGLKKKDVQALIDEDVVLVRDFESFSSRDLALITGMAVSAIERIQYRASKICNRP